MKIEGKNRSREERRGNKGGEVKRGNEERIEVDKKNNRAT